MALPREVERRGRSAEGARLKVEDDPVVENVFVEGVLLEV